MATETRVRLRTTSLEGLVSIPIVGATVVPGTALCGASPLPAPTDAEFNDWYGTPDSRRIYYTFIYYSTNTNGPDGGPGPGSFIGEFGPGPFTRNVEVHTQAFQIPADPITYTRVRNEFFYYENEVAWHYTPAVSIFHDPGLSSADDCPFEIRCCPVPSTRSAADGFLYDYTGAPNVLGEPRVVGPDYTTLFPPNETGTLLFNQTTLPKGNTAMIGNLSGAALVFLSTFRTPTPPSFSSHAGFILTTI